MNRKNEFPELEMPMPQGGQMPEVMRAIMPDFPKWNRLFFQLDCLFAIITLVLTSIFFVFFRWEDLIDISVGRYVLLHIVLPSVLNAMILLAAAALRRRLPETDMRRNLIPVFTMLLMALVVSMIPHIFSLRWVSSASRSA